MCSSDLPTVYGPGDSFAEDSHVMGALIGKFVRAADEGQPVVEVWGDGTQEREFLFVDDAVDGVLTAAARTDALVHNLGVGTAHRIAEIATIIAELSGFRGEIRFATDRFTGVRKRLLDVRAMTENVGWRARTPLREGIRQSIEWYRAHR